MTDFIPYTRNAPSARIGLPMPRGRARAGLFGMMAFALVFTAGCKSSRGGGSGANDQAQHDPLFGKTLIPPTSVPVPEKGAGVGSRNGRPDPLLGSPTGNTKDKKDKTGATRTEDPERWKGPFVPSQATTTAALTSTLRNDHSDLSVDEEPSRTGGARLQLASGSTVSGASGKNLDQIPPVLQEDLEALGIRRGQYEIVRLSTGDFSIRAKVPNKTGGVTSYEEVGASAAAAVQRLLDQLKSENP